MSSLTGPQPPHDAPCVWHIFCNFLPYLYIFTILLHIIWNIYKSATTVTWNDAPCVCLAVWINYHLCVMHWETKITYFFHPCPLFAGASVEFTNIRKLCLMKCLLRKIPHYYYFWHFIKMERKDETRKVNISLEFGNLWILDKAIDATCLFFLPKIYTFLHSSVACHYICC